MSVRKNKKIPLPKYLIRLSRYVGADQRWSWEVCDSIWSGCCVAHDNGYATPEDALKDAMPVAEWYSRLTTKQKYCLISYGGALKPDYGVLYDYPEASFREVTDPEKRADHEDLRRHNALDHN